VTQRAEPKQGLDARGDVSARAVGVIYLFEQRSLRLWLINSGYQVLTYTVKGGDRGLAVAAAPAPRPAYRALRM
jgi:hypothetical protein